MHGCFEVWKESLVCLDFLPLHDEICRFLHSKVCKGLDLFSSETKAEILMKTPTFSIPRNIF